MNTWDELVDEFRALGGTFENVRLGHGPLGRGLFPINPSRPFLIQIPPSLLVDATDIVFDNDVLKIAPGAGAGTRERQFLEDYYAHISWGGGGRSEIERIFKRAGELPAELRQKLLEHYRYGDWFAEPSPALIQQQFIDSRELGGFHDRTVMMPIIELANHGPVCSYEASETLVLKGTTADEITVEYASGDTYSIFHSWGFVTESEIAFSVLLEGTVGGTPLQISRHTLRTTIGARPVPPTLTKSPGGVLKLDFLMLGNRKMPRLCRGNFRSVFRAAGFADADETFDKIRMANQHQFLDLLADLEPLEGSMVRELRRLARLQLQALTYCFGAREF
ncbi:MAG TPA: hypothetical protein VHU18_06030 [Rhizomicrobium sp.]|nr:hypothetical protein [Rhizomicrobium sp.]